MNRGPEKNCDRADPSGALAALNKGSVTPQRVLTSALNFLCFLSCIATVSPSQCNVRSGPLASLTASLYGKNNNRNQMGRLAGWQAGFYLQQLLA